MQARMRQGFLDLAREYSERFRVVDGDRAIEDVAAEIQAIVAARLT